MNAKWVQDGWSLLSVMLEPLLEPPCAETATELSVKQSDVYNPSICTHLLSNSPQHYTQEDYTSEPSNVFSHPFSSNKGGKGPGRAGPEQSQLSR